jgi:hypothetical protein
MSRTLYPVTQRHITGEQKLRRCENLKTRKNKEGIPEEEKK